MCLYTKQATLMKRSTVLGLPLQLVFPGQGFMTLAPVEHRRRWVRRDRADNVGSLATADALDNSAEIFANRFV
jgi:hypothetical protein